MLDKLLQAKTLKVNCYDPNEPASIKRKYSFNCIEFENGLILVSGASSNDWFFANRSCIQANGTDWIESIEETNELTEYTSAALLCSVQGSIQEFGVESVPSSHFELWKKPKAIATDLSASEVSL